MPAPLTVVSYRQSCSKVHFLTHPPAFFSYLVWRSRLKKKFFQWSIFHYTDSFIQIVITTSRTSLFPGLHTGFFIREGNAVVQGVFPKSGPQGWQEISADKFVQQFQLMNLQMKTLYLALYIKRRGDGALTL